MILLLTLLGLLFFFYNSINDRADAMSESVKNGNTTIDDSVLDYLNNSVSDFTSPSIIKEDDDSEDYNEYKVKINPGSINSKIIDRYNEKSIEVVKFHPFYADVVSYSYVDINNLIFKHLPEKAQRFYAMGTYYLTHGYHGLSIAMRTDFEWTYGFGQAPVLQKYIDRIFDTNLTDKTYIKKVTNAGFPVSLKWGTAYIEFASDFTFLGTVILFGIFGFLLACLWIDVLRRMNIISIICLVFFVYNLLFVTSWWQAGISGTDFVLFYGSLFVWICQKIREVFVRKKNEKLGVSKV
jgi:hypothetical protein